MLLRMEPRQQRLSTERAGFRRAGFGDVYKGDPPPPVEPTKEGDLPLAQRAASVVPDRELSPRDRLVNTHAFQIGRVGGLGQRRDGAGLEAPQASARAKPTPTDEQSRMAAFLSVAAFARTPPFASGALDHAPRPCAPPGGAMRARTERWRSGRTHRTRNAAYSQGYRGFESLPLRQASLKALKLNNPCGPWPSALVLATQTATHPAPHTALGAA